MSRISEYKIACADRQDIFQANVNNLIKDGYEPYGEMKIEQRTGQYYGFFQAMIRRSNKTKEVSNA